MIDWAWSWKSQGRALSELRASHTLRRGHLITAIIHFFDLVVSGSRPRDCPVSMKWVNSEPHQGRHIFAGYYLQTPYESRLYPWSYRTQHPDARYAYTVWGGAGALTGSRPRSRGSRVDYILAGGQVQVSWTPPMLQSNHKTSAQNDHLTSSPQYVPINDRNALRYI